MANSCCPLSCQGLKDLSAKCKVGLPACVRCDWVQLGANSSNYDVSDCEKMMSDRADAIIIIIISYCSWHELLIQSRGYKVCL